MAGRRTLMTHRQGQRVLLLVGTIVAAGLLPGCGTPLKAYQAAAGGPTATVRFVDHADDKNMMIFRARGAPDGCNCSTDPLEAIGVWHNIAVLAPWHSDFADKGHDVAEYAVDVQADGTPLRLVLGIPTSSLTEKPGYVTSHYCQAHQSFVPKAGAIYEVRRESHVCRLSVDMVQGTERVPVSTVDYPMCAPSADRGDLFSQQIRNVCRAHPEAYVH
jgi:hypothetical protein